MRPDRLDRVALIEDDHFWFRARRRIVAHACRSVGLSSSTVVLDVGCGTGATLRHLDLSPRSFGIEPHAGIHSSPTVPTAAGAVESLPVRSTSVDLALALDVLEHVDDQAALREIGRVLGPSGSVIVTVPAHPALWSFRDEDAGHLRRYTRRTLRQTLNDAGFTVERCSSFHGTILPLVAMNRVVSRGSSRRRDAEDTPSPRLNRLLGRLTGAEAALAERGIRPPTGTSLIAVASKVSLS